MPMIPKEPRADLERTQREREEQTPSYIARCPNCNGMVMAIVDLPEMKREVANETAKCIRQGYTIERVTVLYVRENWKTCECLKAKRKPQRKIIPNPSLFEFLDSGGKEA